VAHPRKYRDLTPRPVQRWRPTTEQLARFGEQVLSWHQIVDTGDGASPMCTCHSWAVLCPYVRAARDTMRMPVPWDPRTPPYPYRSA
jgi:hypothetical protein